MKTQTEKVREMMQALDRGRGVASQVLAINPDTNRLEVMPQEAARTRNLMCYHPEDKGFYAQWCLLS